MEEGKNPCIRVHTYQELLLLLFGACNEGSIFRLQYLGYSTAENCRSVIRMEG